MNSTAVRGPRVPIRHVATSLVSTHTSQPDLPHFLSRYVLFLGIAKLPNFVALDSRTREIPERLVSETSHPKFSSRRKMVTLDGLIMRDTDPMEFPSTKAAIIRVRRSLFRRIVSLGA